MSRLRSRSIRGQAAADQPEEGIGMEGVGVVLILVATGDLEDALHVVPVKRGEPDGLRPAGTGLYGRRYALAQSEGFSDRERPRRFPARAPGQPDRPAPRLGSPCLADCDTH